MTETPHSLTLQFLAWLASRRRTYSETMEAWQSHCPRHTTWEDAVIEGLVAIENDVVVLTARGKAFLNGSTPEASAATPRNRAEFDGRESASEPITESPQTADSHLR